MPSIFLSHNVKDKPFARRLAKELLSNGVQVWIDEAEMKVGDSLIRKISEGIAGADSVGVVLSPYSVESRWVQKEVEVAATIEVDGRSLTVIPILYKDCEIPLFLRDKLYADFRHRSMFQPSLVKLLDAILPGGFREGIFGVVRNAIAAEISAYRHLPSIYTREIDRCFTVGGSARRRIVNLLHERKKRNWVISNPLNPSTHELLEIRLTKVQGDKATVETEEYCYLRWYGLNESKYQYIYNEKNRQTYLLKRATTGKWRVDADIYPRPRRSRRLR